MRRAVAVLLLFASPLLADKKEDVENAVKMLRSKKVMERNVGIDLLAKLGEDAKSASFDLMDVMIASYPVTRDKSLECLEKIDPAVYKHVVVILTDKDENNQELAIKSLKVAGKSAIGSLPVLVAYLKADPTKATQPTVYAEVQKSILDALPDIAPDSKMTHNAIVAVVGAAANSHHHVYRAEAIQIARTLKIDGKLILPSLLIALNDQAARLGTIQAIGELGPDGKPALTILMKLKFDSDKAIRDAAVAAIEKIKG